MKNDRVIVNFDSLSNLVHYVTEIKHCPSNIYCYSNCFYRRSYKISFTDDYWKNPIFCYKDIILLEEQTIILEED